MRKRTKRWLSPLLLMLLSMLLTGCWDIQPLERIAIISAIGIDVQPNQDRTISVSITNPSQVAQSSSGGSSVPSAPYLLYEVEGKTVNDALQRLDLFVSRRPMVIQTRVLVVGAENARQGLTSDLDTFVRSGHLRRTIRMFVSEGPAADLLRAIEPELEVTPANFLAELSMEQNTSRIPLPMNQIHDFLLATVSKGQEAVLPLIRIRPTPQSKQGGGSSGGQSGGGSDGSSGQGGQGGKQTGVPEIVGLAVFRGGKMVGKMGVEDFVPYSFLTEQADDAYVTIEGKGSSNGAWRVTAALSSTRMPKVEVVRHPDRDLIKVEVRLYGPIVEVLGGQTFSPGWLLTRVESLLRAQVERNIRQLIARAQSEWRSDIFGFGHVARGTFPTWTAWKDYPWTERFPHAEVQVKVDLELRTLGRTTRPPSPE